MKLFGEILSQPDAFCLIPCGSLFGLLARRGMVFDLLHCPRRMRRKIRRDTSSASIAST